VPATITEAKDLLNADIELKACTDTRYSYYEAKSFYDGIEQKCALIQSEEMKKRKENTFDKNIKNDLKVAHSSLNKLKKMEYACYEDAKRAANAWLSEHQRYQFEELSIEANSRRMNGKMGRPKRGEAIETYYSVKAEIVVDEQAVAREHEKLGRFILATNDPCLTADEILSYYKSQSKIECGFSFFER
jgi:transposase